MKEARHKRITHTGHHFCEVLKGRITFALKLRNLVSIDRNFGWVRVCGTVLLAQVPEREEIPNLKCCRRNPFYRAKDEGLREGHGHKPCLPCRGSEAGVGFPPPTAGGPWLLAAAGDLIPSSALGTWDLRPGRGL